MLGSCDTEYVHTWTEIVSNIVPNSITIPAIAKISRWNTKGLYPRTLQQIRLILISSVHVSTFGTVKTRTGAEVNLWFVSISAWHCAPGGNVPSLWYKPFTVNNQRHPLLYHHISSLNILPGLSKGEQSLWINLLSVAKVKYRKT